jgi:preprotein translocase subunit SecF
MEFLTKTNFPFLKYRHLVIWISVILSLIALVLVFVPGLNFGIDFKGGTQLTVKMREAVTANDLRTALDGAGVRDATIQQYGPGEANEFLIRVPLIGAEEGGDAKKLQEGRAKDLIAALDSSFNRNRTRPGDLNQQGSNTFADTLAAADPDNKKANLDEAHTYYAQVGDAIVAKRKELKIFNSWEQVASTPGLSPAALAVLQQQSEIGAFQVIQNENVGAQIGGELRQKGFWAVVLSLLAMLVYMWYRFELRFGVGALVASFHDLIMTLGLFALMGYEFNLSTIAAFLTLVGYSVNDTVVIFDRVRENMRRYRRLSFEEVLNVSINETLPRTIMVSGNTFLACAALFFFGGEVLKGFSFVMLVGVIVGTYSSIFIASPFAMWWDEQVAKRRGDAPAAVQKPANV